ncbi:MAG: TolC family protein, partial [Thermoguttaceae bacterium]
MTLSQTRFSQTVLVVLAASGLIFAAAGCQPQQAFYLTSKGQAQRQYIDKATQISYPDVEVPSVSEVCSREPLTLENPNPTDYWDLSLEEVMRMSLANSKVIRTLNGVNYSTAGAMGVPGMVLNSPQATGTVYDPALTESDPRYGVEAALSVFDAQLKTAANWQKTDRPTYVNENGNSVQQSDTGTFQATIQKLNATGGNTYMTHGNTYTTSHGSIPGTGFQVGTPPNWGSYLEAGFSQPLLQGAGVQFNRVAGPNASPGFYQGAVIARINSDISLVDFEMAVRGLVSDVETAYWNLYYAYHYLQSVKAGRDAALRTWQQTYSMYINEHPRGRAQYEAQARQSYYQLKSQTEIAQSNLFKSESLMRYIMGLSVSDGRLIRPSDEPVIAPVRLDWNSVVCEALSRSPELRKQKWDVKAKELQLTASKNFLMPRVDLNGSYRWQGVGKWLVDPSGAHTSGYGSLADGKYADWTLGVSATMPFGWRRELAGVRNAQLLLSRSRSILQEQELEMTHQLADAFRTLAQTYTLSQTHYQRRIAAEAEVRAVQATYDVGTTTLDQLLAAQQKLAEAETTYYRSVVDYNLALTTLHYRKGSLLEYNGVYLSEGPWPNKAYFDATRQARKRDASAQINYGFTRPRVVSRGAYQQWQPQRSSVSISGDTIDTKNVPTVAPIVAPGQTPAAP